MGGRGTGKILGETGNYSPVITTRSVVCLLLLGVISSAYSCQRLWNVRLLRSEGRISKVLKIPPRWSMQQFLSHSLYTAQARWASHTWRTAWNPGGPSGSVFRISGLQTLFTIKNKISSVNSYFFLSVLYMILNYVCMLSRFSHVWLFAILWTVALQAPLSIGFSRQEYWSGMPCPPPGDFPDPGMEPASHVSGIGRWVLYCWATGDVHFNS